MSGNSQQSSKDRSSNFGADETAKLMFLLKDYPVITNKKTDYASNQQKEAAWKILAENFNSDAIRYRSIKQLQQKYNNMKKNARKEMAAEKYGRRETGGGPPPPKPSETTEWLNSIMGESITGLPAIYDSDALVNTQTTEVPVADTTANINKDLTEDLFDVYVPVAECSAASFPEVEEIKENTSANIEVPMSRQFDSSTPKAMLRKPISKELSFNNKRKSAFTPLETRKRIMLHAEKKVEYLMNRQERDLHLSKYAKEEHEANMRYKEELHNIEVDFRTKNYALILEKSRYEAEKSKYEAERAKKDRFK